jgi:hypothetical protein
LVLLAGLAPAPAVKSAEAGDVAKAFAELEQERSSGAAGVWTAYASGAASGLGWANSMLEARNERRLYCPPRGLPETPSRYAEVAVSEYKGNKPRYDSLGKYPSEAVALAVVNGLIAKYPCR